MKKKDESFLMYLIIGIVVYMVLTKQPTTSLSSPISPVSQVNSRNAFGPGCKDLGLGINKLCWTTDTNDLSASYNINRNYIDQDTYVNRMMLIHYLAGDWAVLNVNNYQNSKGYGVVLRDESTSPAGFYIDGGSISNQRWTPYKLMSSNTGCWSCGAPITTEQELTMDKRSAVLNYHILQGQTSPTGFYLKTNNIPSSAVWSTNIAGKYCGLRFTKTLSAADDIPGEVEIVATVSPCPSSPATFDGTNWKIYYNPGAGQQINVKSIITVTKAYGQDLGSEATIVDWIDNYDTKLNSIASEYNSFISSYVHPSGMTKDQAQDYYMVLYPQWYGTYSAITDTVASNFNIDGTNKIVWTPIYGTYMGAWIWDTSMTSWTWVSAINPATATPFVKNRVSDLIDIWYKNGLKYPVVGEQPGEIHLSAKSNHQPFELFIPVVLNAYSKGLITKDKMCTKFLPMMKSQYEFYKQTAGSDYLFTVYAGYGRDGTDVTASTSATTDITGPWALSAVGMATLANTCGESYSTYVSDYNNIKSNFETLWNPTSQIYSNLNTAGAQYDTATEIYTTPYGVCMAVISGIVPTSRVATIFATLDREFVDTYGYTSANTRSKCYISSGTDLGSCWAGETWDGPTWDWVDNNACEEALRRRIKVNGETGLTASYNARVANSFELVGKATPFASESWDSKTGALAAWGGTPYIPTGFTITSHLLNFDIFNVYNFNLMTGSGCTPVWSCPAWGTCTGGTQTRICTDGCGNSRTESQSCSGTCTPTVTNTQLLDYINQWVVCK